jgi:hypothetical protein
MVKIVCFILLIGIFSLNDIGILSDLMSIALSVMVISGTWLYELKTDDEPRCDMCGFEYGSLTEKTKK